MSRGVKIVLVVVLLGAAAGVAYWQHERAERAEAELAAQREATKAMVEVTTAQASFGDRLKNASTDVLTASMISMPNAGAAITASLLPVIDGYLAKLDRALLLSGAYLAFHPELPQATRDALATLGKTAKQLHGFRDQLVKLADEAAKGTLTLDELASQLAAASMQLLLH
jgi:cytochrome c-type biogenesis protein CcmH/NrfG